MDGLFRIPTATIPLNSRNWKGLVDFVVYVVAGNELCVCVFVCVCVCVCVGGYMREQKDKLFVDYFKILL